MNIKQIRYFAAVADRGSLSAAAKDQFVTVQAVSKAIADLERELGRSLFVRESRGVHPTAFGSAFYQKALPVLHDFDKLEEFAADYQEISRGGNALRLALCSPPFYGNENARANIAAFAKKGLGCDASVALEGGKSGLAKLRSDEYDAIITIGTLSQPDIDCVSVGTVSPGVLMPRNHPLAGKDQVKLAELSEYPVAMSEDFDTFNDSIVTMYRRRNTKLNFTVVTAQNILKHLVMDKGVCFFANIPAMGGMGPEYTIVPIASEDALVVPICLVSMKGRKAPVYCAFERWLSDALVLLGGGAIGKAGR